MRFGPQTQPLPGGTFVDKSTGVFLILHLYDRSPDAPRLCPTQPAWDHLLPAAGPLQGITL